MDPSKTKVSTEEPVVESIPDAAKAVSQEPASAVPAIEDFTPESVRQQLSEMGFSAEKIDDAYAKLKPEVGPNPNVEQLLNAITREERTRLAEERIKERRVLREEEEKQKAIDEEKKRRESGKQMLKTKEELEAMQRIRVAEDMKREKREKEAHRQQVLAQIAADRANQKKEVQHDASASATTTASSAVSTPVVTRPASNTARIAIRLPSGEQITQEFGAGESLAAVRLWVQLQRPDLFESGKSAGFIMPPGKLFGNEDMDTPLSQLSLVPSARLVLKLI